MPLLSIIKLNGVIIMDFDKISSVETIVTTTSNDVYTSKITTGAKKKNELTISFLPANGAGWVNKMVITKETYVHLNVDKKGNVLVELTSDDETKEVVYNKDGHLIGKKNTNKSDDNSVTKDKKVMKLF